ncbi:hypothetical protein BY458DRAFT_494419 [Sporodiniella umbellata]|nr:hypothetical protein BY458DRAFT_494419 [Sporodiniella umbellata]
MVIGEDNVTDKLCKIFYIFEYKQKMVSEGFYFSSSSLLTAQLKQIQNCAAKLTGEIADLTVKMIVTPTDAGIKSLHNQKTKDLENVAQTIELFKKIPKYELFLRSFPPCLTSVQRLWYDQFLNVSTWPIVLPSGLNSKLERYSLAIGEERDAVALEKHPRFLHLVNVRESNKYK